ncbi:hypothetical protein ACIQVT_01970 [Streptomyces sp. NPDC100445]|uniref:hypothetical protein n=1 Tax=Streptomyces sp. NPDC100445 TaxID=3366102 RepID=UPI00382D223A
MEAARWYYWADKLGPMVWQDMPSRSTDHASAASDEEFAKEVQEIVDQHISSPSVVMWTMKNEGWGEQSKRSTGELADAVKQQDFSRLADAHSGVNRCASKGDSGDIIDHHLNHGAANPAPDATRAAVEASTELNYPLGPGGLRAAPERSGPRSRRVAESTPGSTKDNRSKGFVGGQGK